MIKDDEYTKTMDFSSLHMAPEVISNEFNITNKCDIFSIGKIIKYILSEKKSSIENYKNSMLYKIYERCIVNDSELRPNSSELIDDFIFSIILHNININKSIYYFSLAANQNIPQAQFNLGVIYEEGEYISRDINKAIYYYSLAANQNITEA